MTSNLVIVGLIIFDRLVQPGSDLPIALVDFVGDQVISVTTDETGHLDLGMDVLPRVFRMGKKVPSCVAGQGRIGRGAKAERE